jgi:hypothetical protein
LKFFIILLVCMHFSACIFIFIDNLEDYNSETWIVRDDIDTSNNYDIYLASIYWTFETTLTVGYGDITGYTNGKFTLTSKLCYS